MRHRIISILQTHTIRQSAITAVSTFISAGLGAVFYLLLARHLGSNEYGLFSLSLTILMLMVTVSDVGMAQGLIRFIGENRKSDKYLPYASLALRTKLLMGFLSWGLLVIFSKQIAEFGFHQPQLASLLPVTGLGIFSYLLVSYSLSVSQAMQKFILWGGIQIGSNLFRLILFGVLIVGGILSPFSAFLIFSIASLTGFIISWKWLDIKVISSPVSKVTTQKFWNFNKWTALFMVLSSIVSRMDVVITSRYVSLSQVGAYSLAITMVSFLPQLSTALGAVTASKFAGFNNQIEANNYLKKATLLSTSVSLFAALLMIPTAILVILFTGKDYSQALVPFIILLTSLVIFMMGNPLRDNILYYLHKPQTIFWASVIQGITLAVSGFLLIPIYGITGSAISVLISHVSLGITCLHYFLKHSKI